MRPAPNGLLDGLPFRGRLLMPTLAWTLTLISPAMRRQKSLFPQTALESQTPQLMPAPLPRLLLPLLTSDLLLIALIVFFFFCARLRTRDTCNVVSMNIPFSISSLFLLSCQFVLLGFWVVASSELSSLAPWLLGIL